MPGDDRWSVGIGPTVLVTGANRGLGLGVVGDLLKCAEVKAIFAGCRDPEKATALKELQRQHPAVVRLVRIDVCSDASIKEAAHEVKTALCEMAKQGQGTGGLNLLINNSGIMDDKGASLFEPDRQAFLHHYDVNLVGVAMTSVEFIPLLKKAVANGEPARILNISSTLASSKAVNPPYTNALHRNIAYCASKTALNQYSIGLADALKPEQIVVAAMCPGWVRTDLGGDHAPLSVEQSTPLIVKAAAKLGPSDSGTYFDRNGPIPR